MSSIAWKTRFKEALRATGKSHREISIGAGFGEGYVHSITKEGKDPTVSKLLAICESAKISIIHVLCGFDITAEDEKFLAFLKSADPRVRQAVEQLLQLDSEPEAPSVSLPSVPVRRASTPRKSAR